MIDWSQLTGKRIKSLGWPLHFYLMNPLKIMEYESVTKNEVCLHGGRILDLGCGAGMQTALLARHGGQVTGIDVSEGAIGRALDDHKSLMGKLSLQFKCASIHSARFATAEFDSIFSFCVLEHIVDLDRVLAECRRILKPGGCFCFSVDSLAGISDADKAFHSREHHVCRYFTAETLTQCLQEAGFESNQIAPLFRSKTAKQYFLRTLYGKVQFRMRYAPFWVWRIRAAEALCRNRPEGLFLTGRSS